LSNYLFGWAWGALILGALIGWGGLLGRLLFINRGTGWGEKAAWGLALSVVLGGFLNLYSWISQGAILTFLGLGAGFFLADLWRRRSSLNGSLLRQHGSRGEQRLVLLVVLLLGLIIALRYAASVHGVQHPGAVSAVNFNAHDDFYAYFVFPEKMLQSGSMGPDPFSEIRVISSSGGQSFLHTFVLARLHEENLHLLDGGVGLAIVVGLLMGYLRHSSTPWGAAPAVIFLFLWIPPLVGNIASLMTSLALFLSMHRILAWPEGTGRGLFSRAVMIALIIAAICSLKATLIPTCGLFVACSYFLAIAAADRKRNLIREMVMVILLSGVFLLPWSLSLYQSSGTLLYPLLGKGFHGSRYGTFLSPMSGLKPMEIAEITLAKVTDPFMAALFLLGTRHLLSKQWVLEPRRATLSLLIAAILGKFILTMATAGEASYRYSYPFVLAIILILLVEAVRAPATYSTARVSLGTLVVSVLAAGLLMGASWDEARRSYLEQLGSLRDGVRNTVLIRAGERDAYRKMQLSIPARETFLERVEKPFLLDFKRNRVFIVDWPGASSPPPGMPFFQGGEALARYLLSKSVRYVAYSYASEAGFSRRVLSHRLSDQNAWVRTHAQHAFDFQDNLLELGNKRKRIYDDGETFVLDLSIRTEEPANVTQKR
jgi:hypothetical protein